MIISSTPLRISFFFFSGGSDIPAFHKDELGAALSATIDRSVYVMVHSSWNSKIVTKFDTVEESYHVQSVKHLITKNCLLYHNFLRGVTISSMADIPTGGSGLGSSSAYTVGLSNAICHLGVYLDEAFPDILAENACKIEIDMCGFPIGKQDQYAAAYGGFNQFFFGGDTTERVPVIFDFEKLRERLLLYYTGISRNANVILSEQKDNIINNPETRKIIRKNVYRVLDGKSYLTSHRFDDFGNLLHESWMDKKQLAAGITNNYIDNVYSTAMEHGALGGKVLGAGGGGFILFYVPSDETRQNVREMLKEYPDLKEFSFGFHKDGSRILNVC